MFVYIHPNRLWYEMHISSLFTCLQKYIVSVSAGAAHSAAIDDKGTLYLWGDASNGKLGVTVANDQ